MSRFVPKRKKKIGQAPGTLTFVGEQKMEAPLIRIIDYDEDNLQELQPKTIREILPLSETKTVSWINIDGLHDAQLIKSIEEVFRINPLTSEDLLNTMQRPKIEDFGNYVYITLKMLRLNEETYEIKSEQLSLVLMPNIVLTFQEQRGDVFDPVRERIRTTKKRLRFSGSDYLVYTLLDIVIDNYTLVLEKLGDKIESLDEEMEGKLNKEIPGMINDYKREVSFIKKQIKPVRELTGQLLKSESNLIKQTNLVYFNELFDHITQANESVESYKDLLSDLQNAYHSILSNRMNDIMRILTIYAAIFIPLTFIAGIYGTNFEYIPELHYRYGYFIMLGVMAVIAVILLIYFRTKKWM